MTLARFDLIFGHHPIIRKIGCCVLEAYVRAGVVVGQVEQVELTPVLENCHVWRFNEVDWSLVLVRHFAGAREALADPTTLTLRFLANFTTLTRSLLTALTLITGKLVT